MPVSEDDYRTTVRTRYRKQRNFSSRCEAAEAREADVGNDATNAARKRLLSEQVTEDEIAEVVSAWTGVPVSRMLETERAKLLVMEERLHQRVVGQDEAIDAVSNAVRRSRSGLAGPQSSDRIVHVPRARPVSAKPKSARPWPKSCSMTKRAMIRIDMSEFMERHSVSRLIGAPPGYVGYDEGGKLTEAVRRRPYSVVLLDEIEKAHDDVYNILLQILDDGRLTDNHGHTVDFTNTIIVMTSNVGSQLIQKITEEGGSDEEMHEAVEQALRSIRSGIAEPDR